MIICFRMYKQLVKSTPDVWICDMKLAIDREVSSPDIVFCSLWCGVFAEMCRRQRISRVLVGTLTSG
jgi:hypothetical protein